jgi:hypothetical protein
VYPRKARGTLLSFGSSTTVSCLSVKATAFDSYNSAWYHVAVTVTSADVTKVYVNGVDKTSTFVDVSYCGQTTGALVLGQKQDTAVGGSARKQGFDGVVDTLAIYDVVWGSSAIAANKPVGVDLTNLDLYALWSGYTKGSDLVDNANAELWIKQFTDGMPSTDANIHTVDMLSPLNVGGVAWDFPDGQTVHYLGTSTSFAWPSGDWTMELWVKIHAVHTNRYFVSFTTSATDNCMVLQQSGFTSSDVEVWRHIAITYVSGTTTTTVYKDGVATSALIHTKFCGTTTGSLVVGQEQDSLGGSFSSVQSADMAVDTVAIYSSAWTAAEVAANSRTCVSLKDETLWTVWSGFTRGRDLVGNNDASVMPSEWFEGAPLECTAYT